MSENIIDLENNKMINTEKKNNKKDKKKDKKRKEKKKKNRKKLITYLKETRYELKQVSWSTKKETLKYTGIVLLVVLISSLIVYGMDTLLSLCLSLIIK